MLAIAEGVAFFYIVACLTTPVAHLVIVLSPGIYGTIADSDLSPTSSFALEVRCLVHVAVDATTDASDGIGGGEAF